MVSQDNHYDFCCYLWVKSGRQNVQLRDFILSKLLDEFSPQIVKVERSQGFSWATVHPWQILENFRSGDQIDYAKQSVALCIFYYRNGSGKPPTG